MILTAAMTSTHRTLQASTAEWSAVAERIAPVDRALAMAIKRRADAADPDARAVSITMTRDESRIVLGHADRRATR